MESDPIDDQPSLRPGEQVSDNMPVNSPVRAKARIEDVLFSDDTPHPAAAQSGV